MRRSASLLLLFLLSLACRSATSLHNATWTVPTDGAIRIPVEVVNHRVHLPVSVNGGPPGTFILDTGAGTSPLDQDYAKGLGIEGRPGGRAMGAAGSVELLLATGVTYRFNGIEIAPERVALLPLAPVSLRIGRPVVGVLGRDVFRRFVTEFDYGNSQVTLHPPDAYQPPAGAVAIPFEAAHGGLPRIDAKITLEDGRTIDARFLVDSGAGAAVVLKRHFVNTHGIDTSKAMESPGGLGVGGAARARVGRIRSLDVGGFTIERPVTMFSLATAGALASEESDGLIGGEILRRFTMTVDAGRSRLLFVPNRALRDPFEFDMSGIHLTARDATFQAIDVFEVVPNTPAAEAGLRAGDELRAIDGHTATPSQLPDIRNLFRQPGKRYEITVLRNGVEEKVMLTTRRMV